MVENLNKSKAKVGFALSGSGNRSSFYIGFLEVLTEHHVPIDYISACSGGSLVAAAFACGALREFKEMAMGLDKEQIKVFFAKGGKGGLYSLDYFEEVVKKFTKGLTFGEVKPQMSFTAVNIGTGEIVDLCMGDIARAVRISCTLPGIFEPILWGGKALVDGGLLTSIPTESLKTVGADIIIGVNMRGTKHIFTNGQMTLKKIFNGFKKLLFLDELENLINILLPNGEQVDWAKKQPKLFEVLGKSLDIAIKAEKLSQKEPESDLLIVPDFGFFERNDYSAEAIKSFYLYGRTCALEYVPKIKQLITEKND